MARTFTVEDIGRLSILQSAVSLLVLLTLFGLDQAYVRNYNSSQQRHRLLRTCFAPGFLVLGIIAGVSMPFAAKISTWLYGTENRIWYALTVLFAGLTYVARFSSLIVRMGERGAVFAAGQTIPKVVLLLFFTTYLVLNAVGTFTALLSMQIVAAGIALSILTWFSRREYVGAAIQRIDKGELKALIGFGFPLIGAGLAFWGLTWTSTVALRTFASFTELGIYALAASFSGVGLLIQSIFATVWWPIVYKWVEKEPDSGRAKILRVERCMLALVCMAVGAVGMLSGLLDLILPEQYQGVKYLIPSLMLNPLLYTLSETTIVGVNVTRRTALALLATVIAFAVNGILNLLLVPVHGATGAVIANAVAFCAFLVARTEASIFAWGRIPRVRLYVVSGTLAVFSSLHALFAPQVLGIAAPIWALLMAATAWYFRSDLLSAYRIYQDGSV